MGGPTRNREGWNEGKIVKFSGWVRLAVAVSTVWLSAVGAYALYERFLWTAAVDGHGNYARTELFWFYYDAPAPKIDIDRIAEETAPGREADFKPGAGVSGAFVRIRKGFRTPEFVQVAIWPVGIVWFACLFLPWAAHWVRAGFDDGKA